MKTIQITVNESLLRHVDRAIATLKTTRSAFIRESLKKALTRFQTKKREAKHRRGYLNQPDNQEDLSDWETEQAWGDE